MQISKTISIEELNSLLSLDEETGKLFWKERSADKFSSRCGKNHAFAKTWNKKFAGKEALACEVKGYLRGSIFDKRYEAHQVAFAIANQRFPISSIDHINGNRKDNRPCNLREADRTMQARNAATPSTNKSGIVGVCWDKSRNKWAAFIHLNNRIKHLGRFNDFQDAVARRKSAEKEHGFHPNHGRKAA